MSKDTSSKLGTKATSHSGEDDPRAAALRANLVRRKGQTSARRSGKGVGKSEPSAFDRLEEKDGKP